MVFRSQTMHMNFFINFMINVRDINFFTKKFTTVDVWWVVISKLIVDLNENQ